GLWNWPRGCWTARRCRVRTSPVYPTQSSWRSASTRFPTRSPPARRRSSATSSVSASSACPASDRTAVRFLPTDEQLELQRGVRDLLAARWPLDRIGDGFDRQLWS